MYSNVDQASALNATYGLSESMVDPVPSRYTPPSLTAVPPLDELPHAAATRATTAAATASGHGRRDGRGRVCRWSRRGIMHAHLRLSTPGGGWPADPWLGRRSAAASRAGMAAVIRAGMPELPVAAPAGPSPGSPVPSSPERLFKSGAILT